jgi:hypothetical protein
MTTRNNLSSNPGGKHGDDAGRVTVWRPMQIRVGGKDHERDDKL